MRLVARQMLIREEIHRVGIQKARILLREQDGQALQDTIIAIGISHVVSVLMLKNVYRLAYHRIDQGHVDQIGEPPVMLARRITHPRRISAFVLQEHNKNDK